MKRKPITVPTWKHPKGTPVIVRKDDGSEVHTVTRSDSWIIGGHSEIVMLEGISGGYDVSRVRPGPHPGEAEAGE